MRNVSNGFKNTMETRRDFYSRAVFTFPDGDNLTLGKSEFSISGNGIVDGAGSNAFPLGAVIAKQVTFPSITTVGNMQIIPFMGRLWCYTCVLISKVGRKSLKLVRFML